MARQNAKQGYRGIVLALMALVTALAAAGPATAQSRVVPQSREDMQLSFAPLVKRAAPAVVNIFAQRTVQARANPFMGDPFFRRFFGDGPFRMPDRMQRSLGSGVIVRPEGIVLTNHHVIEGADEITVALADRREFSAELILSDERTDIAVLRMETSGETFPFIDFADSDGVEAGDLVLAIGNPFGIGQTVTSGIVSATSRAAGITDFGLFIQTDAAINPGNSGGALIGMDGGLIGINTAIFSRSGGSLGIGFAVPSNMARTVLAAALAGGQLVRPWAGMGGQQVTPDVAQSLGLDRPSGVLIRRVFRGGPADRAGIEVGDVIYAINGVEVLEPEAMRFRIATLPIGSEAEVTLFRNGQWRSATFRAVAPPDDPPRNETRVGGRNPLSGATVMNVNPAVIAELNLSEELEGGVIIGDVEQGSRADASGLRSGDIILNVNGQAVQRVSQLERALDRGSRRWRLQLRREDQVITLVMSG